MADRVLPSREMIDTRFTWGHVDLWNDEERAAVNDVLDAYVSGRLVDREASVPIAWCYLHNAVRDHHIETERCDVPRSLLVRLDAALPDWEV